MTFTTEIIQVLIFLALQTGALIWCLATLSANIRFMSLRFTAFEAKLFGKNGDESFYRKEEAEKQILKRDSEIKEMLLHYENMRDRLHKIENDMIVISLDNELKKRRELGQK